MTASPSGQAQTTGPRLAREQATMAAMMALYCRDHHGTRNGSCDDCAQLLDYARRRLATCPFGEEKPACNNCQVHCYSASQRERVRVVMRYAGPRMLLRHPILSLYHLLDKRREAPPLVAIKRERSAAGHSGDRAATKP
ncbi:MAG: nitrous oxide-stimulated promoter family protein [Chromatiaceae bacterium]|jgi:predicted amidophosphoribosyltransferase|nr:nitrous oxide-stimulated promoter family protein [Chromatiaceae bacterium]